MIHLTQLLLLIFLQHYLCSSVELPRGVPFARSSFYQVGEVFTCLDGSGTLPWLKVNDDYCDCRDGSDEPGTSACANGQFFCRDMQYKSVALPSAYVDDTYCDCCDGSDEFKNVVSCPSTCSALAASLREARSIKHSQVVQGHKIFKEYIAKLKERKEQQRLEEERAAAEKLIHPDEPLQEPSVTEASASDVKPDLIDPVVPSTDDAHKSDDIHRPDINDQMDVKSEESDQHHEDDQPHEDKSHEQEQPEPSVPPSPPIDYGPEEGFRMLTELPEGCLELNDQEYVYKLCPFQAVYQRSRDSSSVGDGTLIGSWSRWLESDLDEKSYEVMLYENGVGCWNGPVRSAKVFVHCGNITQLTSVQEPSRCEYVLQLVTPAACYEAPDELFKKLHPDE